MATKKQKRAAALAKREAYMAQYRAEGLAALEAERERRKKKQDETVEAIQNDVKITKLKAIAKALKNGRDEVTVGEFLEASNTLLPAFSG